MNGEQYCKILDGGVVESFEKLEIKVANVFKVVQVVQDGQCIQGCPGHQGSQVIQDSQHIQGCWGDFNVQQQLMYDYLDLYRWVLALLHRRWIEFIINNCNKYDSNER